MSIMVRNFPFDRIKCSQISIRNMYTLYIVMDELQLQSQSNRNAKHDANTHINCF